MIRHEIELNNTKVYNVGDSICVELKLNKNGNMLEFNIYEKSPRGDTTIKETLTAKGALFLADMIHKIIEISEK